MPKELRVTARSLVRSRKKKEWQMPSVLRLVGLRNFFWMFLLGGLAIFLHLRGTPHILFEYTHMGSKNRMISCTYLGLNSQTVSAIQGNCSIIRFLK